MAFIDFVLDQLPPPPCRILEIGCGREGGLVPALAAAGYDVTGIDPDAPAGDRYLRARFEELEASNSLLLAVGAVVAGRVLHHLRPLGPGLDRLAGIAPLLLVDEFARDLIGPAAQRWYEERRRELPDAPGPESLDDWRGRHPDLHPHDVLLRELRARWDEVAFEWVPYLHRWLGDPASEARERELAEAGAFPLIGWRFAGSRHGAAANG